jgi:hypothetical protein
MNEARDSKCMVCQCSLKKKNVVNDDDDDDNQNNNVAVTVGIIPLMDAVMEAEGTTYRVCSPCPHITQTGLEGAHWSCGYRNISMLCHSLIQVPEYRRVLFNGDGDIPDVHGIQVWIERAWAAGFDQMVRLLLLLLTYMIIIHSCTSNCTC